MIDLGRRLFSAVRAILYVVGVGLLVCCLLYGIFALVMRTDTEKVLIRENKMYESSYRQMLEREALLKDAIAALQYKDADIYDHVFHSNAPNVDPMGSLYFLFASDSIPDSKLASYTRDKSSELLGRASSVDSAFARIFATLAGDDVVLPPMTLPLADITYPQVGASVGNRMNPFYKAMIEHDGVDFFVMTGTPVYAAADGVVGSGSGASKVMGKLVEIEHAGAYVTRYAHLETVLVTKGQKVRRGQKIGTVGISGRSYAPHLHYEVRKDGKVLDPLGHVFALVSPQDYANMLYMGANTMQSMD